MNDTVTILGNVAAEPVRNTTGRGDAVINFRLASPQRRYDPRSSTWVEGETNWYDVSAFRQLADHAKSSLRIGDPVIVTGRLRVRRWESNGKRGTAVEIEADAIGHDLRRGTAAFTKPYRAGQNAEAPASERSADRAADVGGVVSDAESWEVPAEDEQAPAFPVALQTA
ncbi:single-stranded DNA-binding protein [Microbacterium sp.]|uniref:single-stranded DNA-binding protein n=1 Tax=Microbacterium sp. TaxID=51671 RepID=UPI0033412EC1